MLLTRTCRVGRKWIPIISVTCKSRVTVSIGGTGTPAAPASPPHSRLHTCLGRARKTHQLAFPGQPCGVGVLSPHFTDEDTGSLSSGVLPKATLPGSGSCWALGCASPGGSQAGGWWGPLWSGALTVHSQDSKRNWSQPTSISGTCQNWDDGMKGKPWALCWRLGARPGCITMISGAQTGAEANIESAHRNQGSCATPSSCSLI